MRFEHDGQRASYERLKGYMEELFGDELRPHPDAPALFVRRGSAVVSASVLPLGDESVVRVHSRVVSNVEPAAELFEYLIRENTRFLFGAFSVDEEDDVAFACHLLGDTLDADEIRWAIDTVATTADEYDDEIVRRFGGQRAKDRAEAGSGEFGWTAG